MTPDSVLCHFAFPREETVPLPGSRALCEGGDSSTWWVTLPVQPPPTASESSDAETRKTTAGGRRCTPTTGFSWEGGLQNSCYLFCAPQTSLLKKQTTPFQGKPV